MSLAVLRQAMKELKARVWGMVATGDVVAVDDSGPVQILQLRLTDGETASTVRRVQNYGRTSHPLAGMLAAVKFVFGNRTRGLATGVDSGARPRNLAAGEMADWTVFGHLAHWRADGSLVVTIPGDLVWSVGGKVVVTATDIEHHAATSILTDVGGYAEKLTHQGEADLLREIWHDPAVVTDAPDHTYPLGGA